MEGENANRPETKFNPDMWENFDHTAKEKSGQIEMVTLFGPLMREPFSEMGTERVARDLSFKPRSERN